MPELSRNPETDDKTSSSPSRNARRIAVGVFGALTLGIVGNALWDLLFRSVYFSGRDLILNVLSLGINSIKDMTYAQISAGYHEEASHNILLFILVTLIVVGMAASLASIVLTVLAGKVLPNPLKRSDTPIHDRANEKTDDERNEKMDPSSDEIGQSGVGSSSLLYRSNVFFSFVRPAVYVFAVVFLTAATLLLADFIRFQYVNSAILHFEQTLAVTSPHMSEAERLIVRSEFAQIRNKNDYDRVIRRLEKIGMENGQVIPVFSSW